MADLIPGLPHLAEKKPGKAKQGPVRDLETAVGYRAYRRSRADLAHVPKREAARGQDEHRGRNQCPFDCLTHASENVSGDDLFLRSSRRYVGPASYVRRLNPSATSRGSLSG